MKRTLWRHLATVAILLGATMTLAGTADEAKQVFAELAALIPKEGLCAQRTVHTDETKNMEAYVCV